MIQFQIITIEIADTDSLTYEIKTRDIYEDMMNDKHLFDRSDYPPAHRLYSIQNKQVPGKMKDESFGIPPSEFVCLRSKIYLFEIRKRTPKGVKRCVI